MMADSNRKTGQQRAGRYLQQAGGYRAFIPTDLPPKPPLQMSNELIMLLADAQGALGRLDGSTETLPDPDFFVNMFSRQEAVLSSRIEGTQASLIQVLELESATRPTPAGDVREVVNYVEAMKSGLKRLKTLPLSLRLIREIHETLMLVGIAAVTRGKDVYREGHAMRRRARYRGDIETRLVVDVAVVEVLLSGERAVRLVDNQVGAFLCFPCCRPLLVSSRSGGV